MDTSWPATSVVSITTQSANNNIFFRETRTATDWRSVVRLGLGLFDSFGSDNEFCQQFGDDWYLSLGRPALQNCPRFSSSVGLLNPGTCSSPALYPAIEVAPVSMADDVDEEQE